MTSIRRSLALIIILLISNDFQSKAQDARVQVDFSVKKKVGGISKFNRQKHITIHSSITERDWEGLNVFPDMRKAFFEDLNVYNGRDTGLISWILSQSVEDPSRPGFIDPAYMKTEGAKRRTSWKNNTKWQSYKHRESDMIVGGQLHPYWPGGASNGGKPTAKNKFYLLNGAATGEYEGHFLNEFFKNDQHDGPEPPPYFEIVNEPLWHLVTIDKTNTPEQVFQFHNDAADAIRSIRNDIKIGGYVTAFPDYDKKGSNNKLFDRWHERMKKFYDISGEKMDFVSIHLYDFPEFGNKIRYRKGANLEATLNLMEQYSMMKFGRIIPMLVSEYGAQTHNLDRQGWTAERDWANGRSITPMMLQFMERDHLFLKTLPFIVTKAEWGRNRDTGWPYGPRLLIQEKEVSGTSSFWQFSDLVKFYELWKEVEGEKAFTQSTDVDIKTDAYVDKNKAYLILSNLEWKKMQVELDLFEIEGNPITSVMARQMTFIGGRVQIVEKDLTDESIYDLDSEASAIITFSFEKDVEQIDTTTESKYYSDIYLQEIKKDTDHIFNLNNVTVPTKGSVLLQVGIGREHNTSLKPRLKFNDAEITFPSDWQGDDQKGNGTAKLGRENFFGSIDVKVPLELLKENNKISLTFDDRDGGAISTVTLKVEDWSKDISFKKNSVLALNEIEEVNNFWIPNPSNGVFNYFKQGGLKIQSYKVMDVSGKIVVSKSNSEMIDLSSFEQGIYFVQYKLQGEKVSQFSKLIKQ